MNKNTTTTISSKPILEKLPDGSTFPMIFVKGSTFRMGDDNSSSKWEKPAHDVQVSDFFIGKFPVTQALWKTIMGVENNPSYFKGDQRPVETVSWHDAKKFIDALNDKATVFSYRLPSEAEWEYAARGGIHWKDGFTYAGSNFLEEVAWFRDNSHRESKRIGLKYPNQLGIHDMSGNVWEWCEDDWHDNYSDAPKDGQARVAEGKRASFRVRRGGSWFDTADFCRCAYRARIRPDGRVYYLGFRLVGFLQSDG